LRCVVYTSRGGAGWTRPALSTLHEAASRRNLALRVTGRLVLVDGRFIQVLEGPAAAVATVYAAILADRRHHDVHEVMNVDVAARAFAQWNMDLLTQDTMTAGQVAEMTRLAEAGDGAALLAGVSDMFLLRTLRATPLRGRAAATLSRLLDGGDRLLSRGGLGALTIRALADEAAVGEKTTYRYFSQPADVVRMLVRRRQHALFAHFETTLLAARFTSAVEMATFTGEHALACFFSDPRIPRRLLLTLLRDYHDIAFDELWAMGGVMADLARRDLGLSGAGLQSRLAGALGGLGGMAKMAALHAPQTIREPALARAGAAMFLAALTADGPAGPSAQESG